MPDEAQAATVEPAPVLCDGLAFEALVRWATPLSKDLSEQLALVRARVRGRLDDGQREALAAAVERLRMLQIVEQGLAVGDTLPDFALPDAAGRIQASDELLRHGPLAVAFVRGIWCPYCSLCLVALNQVAPEIARAGGSLVVVVPAAPAGLARIRAERGLRLTLLGDPDTAYAGVCGVRYEMSEGQAALYRSFGLDLAQLNDCGDWSVPVPATYVAGRDGTIAFAHADPDWSRRAEPGEILETVRRLARA